MRAMIVLDTGYIYSVLRFFVGASWLFWLAGGGAVYETWHGNCLLVSMPILACS